MFFKKCSYFKMIWIIISLHLYIILTSVNAAVPIISSPKVGQPFMDNLICEEHRTNQLIDLSKSSSENLSAVEPLKFVFSRSVQHNVLYNDGSQIHIGNFLPGVFLVGGNLGKDYLIKSIDFETTTEHSIDDTTYPLEIHIYATVVDCNDAVCEFQDYKYVILTVLYHIGAEPNKGIDNVLKYVDNLKSGEEESFVNNFILEDLVPTLGSYFTYKAQSIHPPCTNATWLVLEKSFSITDHQLKILKLLQFNRKSELQIKTRSGTSNLDDLDRKITFVSGGEVVHLNLPLPEILVSSYLIINIYYLNINIWAYITKC